MKKFIAVLMLCAASFCSVNAGEINWGEKLAFYLPNRLLDALDTFSVNLGVGPVAQARLMVPVIAISVPVSAPAPTRLTKTTTVSTAPP